MIQKLADVRAGRFARTVEAMSPDCRLIVHASSASVVTWVENEIADLVAWRHHATTIAGLVEALGRGIASSDDIAIVDLDQLSGRDAVVLRAGIEASWWRGTLVGLGRERDRHRRTLTLAHTIPRPFGSEALRALVTKGRQRDTQPNLVIRR